ncbi:serine hydrolase domain-containing protein [Demequina silvatica]|uniref:serine hydrolase domain-containing protein n=1 Tax=Demequina silvatica TaxID=1638988 RepID=UPI0007844EAF|nr:serine hydrolase domain-containing protein [Demequina silvatica]
MTWTHAAAVEAAAARGFSGVVTVDVGEERVFELAAGLAHRAHAIPVTASTSFGLASVGKAFTALAVMRLVEDGALDRHASVGDLLNTDAPPIAPEVTVDHLLTHTGGFTDYLDESHWSPEDHVLTVPPHTLTTAGAFLPLLAGTTQARPPGTAFAYSNAGYVLLGVILERLTRSTHHQAVRDLVLDPAGLRETGFPRLDSLPAGAATGYLREDGDWVNTLHLPVLAAPDGGVFSTAADLHRFWRALLDGRIVARETVDAMTSLAWDVPDEGLAYGRGFWLDPRRGTVLLEGHDAGVSCRTTHDRATGTTVTVLSNTSEGAWPVVAATLGAPDG